MTNISIVGAGTAGLSIAYLLSRERGFSISVYERNKSIGKRYGNTVQAIRNYNLEDDFLTFLKIHSFPIDQDLFHPIYRQVRVFPKEKTITLESKGKPAFYTIYRGNNQYSIDNYFKIKSEENGVHFKFGKHVVEIDKSANDIQLFARGSKAVKSNFFLNGYEYHYLLDSFPINTIFTVFDPSITPRGYAYIMPFPINGKVSVTVGAVLENKKPVNFDDVIDRLLSLKICKKYISGYKTLNKCRVIAKSGFLKYPKKGIFYLGEEFGALDAALGFGNANCIKMSLALRNSLINKNKKFVKELNKFNLIKDLKASLVRRMVMRKYTAENYERKYQELYSISGENDGILPYKLYKNYKSKEKNKALKKFQKIFASIYASLYLHKLP